MLDYSIDSGSQDDVLDHIEQTRLKILGGIRWGMRDAMQGLANAVGGNTPVKSGRLLAAILRSPRVTETKSAIRGRVSGNVGGKPVGLWQEFGIHVPALQGKLITFVNSDGQRIFSRGHKEFSVPGKPFMNPTLDAYKTQILDTLQQRVDEAVNG